ncbi:PDR/VanB family oxidoreductase [Prauserella oleivorans]
MRHTGFDLDVVVRQRWREADGVVGLRLAPADGVPLPTWVPGAHIDLTLPSGRCRQYSLCGEPADRSAYRIAVRRIPGGTGSGEIHDRLARGTPLRIRGPRNAFRLVDAPSYLFVAGGIGSTPILPMVRACARLGLPWRLVYLGRSRATLPFLDELAGYGGRVDVRTDDEHGPPDIADLLPSAGPGAAVYVCGPPPLMAAAYRLLQRLDPTASLHTERFSPPPVLGGRPFDVELRRTGTTVRVAADETALAAVRRALPGVAYSCRQGFCGTCRVRVLAGEVEHRDTRLPAADRETAMLLCVSRAARGRLVLDL